MGILSVIADGDGDFVSLDDLQQRDVLILKDLKEAGYISGTTFLSGGGRYRITAAGEERLEVVRHELTREEAGIQSSIPAPRSAFRASTLRNLIAYVSEHLLWPIVVGIVLLLLTVYLGLVG